MDAGARTDSRCFALVRGWQFQFVPAWGRSVDSLNRFPVFDHISRSAALIPIDLAPVRIAHFSCWLSYEITSPGRCIPPGSRPSHQTMPRI